MIRYIWSFILEFVGAIICIISPTPIETPEDKGDDSDADADAGSDGSGGGGGGSLDGESAEGGGGISGDGSPDEEENCGGGGGGGNSSSGGEDELSGFSDFSNCDDGDKAGSGFDIALYIIIEFFINS